MNWLRLPLSAVTFALLTLTLALAACGGDEPESTAVDATPEPTQTAETTSAAKSTSTEAEPTSVAEATPPELTPSPEAAATPETTPVMSDNAAKLAEYAAEPGAIFARDPMQLVGLPPPRVSCSKRPRSSTSKVPHSFAYWRPGHWHSRTHIHLHKRVLPEPNRKGQPDQPYRVDLFRREH